MAPVAVGRLETITRSALPLGVLVFFAATAAGYGVFRDELYYFACARHLDWGYVDHPPGVALLAALVRALVGESWIAARLLSAAAAAGTVLLAGDTARELGGGRGSSRSF
jgi:4-amino-4-deoxy-L-arabinose transferase-like glycosyltransferase